MRREFSKGVRAKAADRSKGLCEGCGVKLPVGGYHYDHDVPDGLGGEPTLENCRVLCLPCHKVKTIEHDNPRMQKADRQRKSIALDIRNPAKIQSAGFPQFKKQARATSPLRKQMPERRGVK